MSASQFIASLVSSLAWPAVVVTILVVFRRQFGTMLERMSRFKLGPGGQDAESDWERTEDTVRQSLSAARRARPQPVMACSPWSMIAGRRWKASCGMSFACPAH